MRLATVVAFLGPKPWAGIFNPVTGKVEWRAAEYFQAGGSFLGPKPWAAVYNSKK